MGIKIAVVGAGSVGFTRAMIRDILSVPELSDAQIALTDISRRNLEMVTKLIKRDIEGARLPAKVTATSDRRKAFKDANYVFSFVRVGGLEAFATDIDVPLTYGVDQCVGDTLGPGGIMYGQRTMPVVVEFCRDIAELAAPGCLFLNYSNPMAMNTWACNVYGEGVKVVGLCHGVFGGHELIAKVLGLPREEVDIVCAGINHQTWYISVKHNGEDLTAKLLPAMEKNADVMREEKVRVDMLRRFGYFSTESNGHLSEYVPWYRKRVDEIKDWIDTSTWINGETGGYLRACTEGRNWFEHDFPNWMKQPPLAFGQEHRGHEHGSYILESLETGRTYRGHFNVVNRGVIPNLPSDAIIEVPGYVDHNGMNIPVVGDLPLGCAAVCNASISVQRLSVEAAARGDDQLLRQAFMMDPLTGAVLNPPEIWQMVDDMLVAGEAWLPQYKKAIAEAKKRRKSAKRLPTKVFAGAARLHTKSVAEMAKDRVTATRLASASEKAGKDKKA